MIYRRALRPLLFAQDPEAAHERTIELLATAARLPAVRRVFTHAKLQTEVAGIRFPNPVGLAAGCDKNARAVAIWPHFGFGFVEVGTVTAQPQPGNPKPRLFRVPEQGALINRLGFNSEGSEVVAKRIAQMRRRSRPLPVPLGINIGKTKLVSGEEAVLEDYRTSFRRLSRLADFIVVNVSSPNTPGLRQWQERGKLTALLGTLMAEAQGLATKRGTRPVPLFVKISPDMADADMDDVAEVALELGLAGIIATNTTIAREGAFAGMEQAGGLSGKPLRERATEVISYLYRRTEGRLPLIGVGGIFTAEDAYARLRAGASLVQLYTGLIYEGPYLPRRINQGLLRLMERDGVGHISEVIGVDAA
ncbi:MAG TPA: quinone-dependent dihydroorotate dehydrogenase [Chthonomonadaceae bacterium]|nr:quinone-dependent dihydroorotate dehydrogenase [Chthonomonadaceae bacterium]